MLDGISEEEKGIFMPQYILRLLRDVRIFLRDEMVPQVICSDRRLLKIAKMLRTSATTNDRKRISISDCILLKHVLWHSPEDQVEHTYLSQRG